MCLLDYARASQYAYEHADIDEPSTDTQVAFYGGCGYTIVAFRGTTSLQDWDTNINGGFVALRDSVLVREGFADAWISVKDRVTDWIAANSIQDRLCFAGHSLGGALATVAAIDLAPVEQINLVTFGAPRALHNLTPTHANVRPLRVVNNNDVVPRVPPEFQGYRHAGKLVYFNEAGEYVPDIGLWSKLADRIEGRINDIGELGTDGIKDHDMAEYVRLCEAWSA